MLDPWCYQIVKSETEKKMLELSVQVLFFMELWEGAFNNTYNYKTT